MKEGDFEKLLQEKSKDILKHFNGLSFVEMKELIKAVEYRIKSKELEFLNRTIDCF